MLKGKSKYEDSFKKQLVELYNNGKPAGEIIAEYHISSSSLWKWIKYYNATGSFTVADNLSEVDGAIGVKAIIGQWNKLKGTRRSKLLKFLSKKNHKWRYHVHLEVKVNGRVIFRPCII